MPLPFAAGGSTVCSRPLLRPLPIGATAFFREGSDRVSRTGPLVVDSAAIATSPQEVAGDVEQRWVHRVFKRFFDSAPLAEELGGEIVREGRWFVAVAA